MPRLLALLCLALAGSASRLQTDLEQLSAEEEAQTLRAIAWTGKVLRGRYHLLELQENNPFRKMNPVRKVKKMIKKYKAKRAARRNESEAEEVEGTEGTEEPEQVTEPEAVTEEKEEVKEPEEMTGGEEEEVKTTTAQPKEEVKEPEEEQPEEPAEYISRQVGDFPWGASRQSPLSKEEFEGPEELGRGSYGDAWRAYDAKTKEEVVVKIFYRGESYVTKKSMKTDPYAISAVEEGDYECKLVHEMMAQESSYPEGRGHICNCLASHAMDQKREDDVSFLVLEQCGQSLRSKMMAQWEAHDPAFYADVRHWMKGLLGAVRFMSGLKTPMLHLDIHWDNIVITEGNEAKLIDFGFTQAFNEPFPEVEHWRSPPEHVWTKGGTMGQYPRNKAWAYDVWSTGALYSEILCGKQSFPFSTVDASGLPGFQEGQSHFKCRAGEEGFGEEQDWAVVNAALTGYEHRKSPEELMNMLS